MTTLQTLEAQLEKAVNLFPESSRNVTYLREKIAEYRVIRDEALEEAACVCDVEIYLVAPDCASIIRNLKGK